MKNTNDGNHLPSAARWRLQLAEADAPQARVQLRHVNRTRDLRRLSHKDPKGEGGGRG